MLNQALVYLSKGISVIPVGLEKRPLVVWADFQERCASEEEVRSWWAQYPQANIGIVTGKISDTTVVDVDAKTGGLETIKTLGLPATLLAKTGGGGWHYYYRYTPVIKTGTARLPGIDIRNDGGYVVAPPSLHASGNRYEWSLKIEREGFPVDRFPKQETQTDWKTVVLGVPDGIRNDTAARFAGKLMSACRPEDWEGFVWPALLGWDAKNQPPLGDKKLRVVFESIAKRATKNYQEVSEVTFLTFTELLDRGKKELLAVKPEDVVSFGYEWLDNQLTGLFPGELVVVGGESGTGKTTFCTNMIYRASKHRKCGVFALEDRLEDYAIKALYFKIGLLRKQDGLPSNYPWNDYRKNAITDPQFQQYLSRAEEELRNDNVSFAVVERQMNIELLEQLIEQQIARGIDLFLIDHLHYFDLLKSDKTKADYIEQVMMRLRTLQRRTGARIILVVHYRKLDGKKPSLDSFKDSISIVQNATYVINLWRDRSKTTREDYYKTKFIIPKNKNPNGEMTIEVEFDPFTGDYRNPADWQYGTLEDVDKSFTRYVDAL